MKICGMIDTGVISPRAAGEGNSQSVPEPITTILRILRRLKVQKAHFEPLANWNRKVAFGRIPACTRLALVD
jgi:hypothetical protein